MNEEQTDLLAKGSADHSRAGNAAPIRLGLMVEHRRLFRALGAGWLYPLAPDVGQVVDVGSVARTPVQAASRHAISVRLGLNMDKLPDLEVPIFRKGEWTFGHLQDIQSFDDAVYWPGAIPTFAISSMSVSSTEEKHRLVGMTRVASNLDLSDLPINVAEVEIECAQIPCPQFETEGELTIPPSQDAIFGALTMAVWGVPRVDPWMDVLQASVASDAAALARATASLDVPWWRFPPWRQCHKPPRSLTECLWLATVDVFQKDCNDRQLRPRDLSDRIAEHAMLQVGKEFEEGVVAWRESTTRLLRTEATLQPDAWRRNAVGLAIQLVLTRPNPDRFKTWFKDMPDLPPGVAWSAATLCGLLNGYKRLAKSFRGCALQRELLSIAALSACSSKLAKIQWPNGRLELGWRREGGCLVLSHGGQDLARKPQHARGKWYMADFKNDDVIRAAKKVAEDLNWPCHVVIVENDQVRTSGTGKLKTMNGNLEVDGRVKLHLTTPTFDIDSFRRSVAIGMGEVPAPPAAPASKIDIPGLAYVPDFLDEDHERQLIEWIDQQDWSSELKRRVQHYGWRYDYKTREVDASMRLGPLPGQLTVLAERLFQEKLVPEVPDQVIVNEYGADQGITPHVDNAKGFADGIAMISLLQSWEMVFHAPHGKEKVPRMLERRSVAIMHGEARYRWKHEIKKRKSEPALDGGGKRRKRERRISLTFRKVLSPRNPTARARQAQRREEHRT